MLISVQRNNVRKSLKTDPDKNPGKYTTSELLKVSDRWKRFKFAYEKFNSSGVGGLSGNLLYDKYCDKVNYCWHIKVNFDSDD